MSTPHTAREALQEFAVWLETERRASEKTIEAYQRLGTWRSDITITPELFGNTIDVFLFSGHITSRPTAEGIVGHTPGA